eukprot:gnl/TRDRNA2_/TRDRNA2_192866_c0_seq1.p1 gnl/TRDRNA2_/TRDRNA2_192866_c0~~gnl/TRDRNA2_/TRDRNA2_192866_c0_seq1.p1  ORF type:complete len:141 (-),score=44.52 gnl/TRDRNA2_/TRDRNA2_192866_c0_seq1:79-501(-)
MAPANPPETERELTPQEVQAAFQQIEKECTMLINKISELDQEVNEHNLVVKAFEKVEPTRRCFRMVGGVLTERTVAEVRPAVESNAEKIRQAAQQLEKQLQLKSQQRAKFQEKYGLNKPKEQGGGQPSQPSAASTGSVLV